MNTLTSAARGSGAVDGCIPSKVDEQTTRTLDAARKRIILGTAGDSTQVIQSVVKALDERLINLIK